MTSTASTTVNEEDPYIIYLDPTVILARTNGRNLTKGKFFGYFYVIIGQVFVTGNIGYVTVLVPS